MKSKIDLKELETRFRETILYSSVVEVSPNGVWVELSSGETHFIARTNLRLMAKFLLKIAAYEEKSSNV